MGNNDQMRFSFLTNAKTMGMLGVISGVAGIATGFILPRVGLTLGAEATAMALVGYRQQKKQAGNGKAVYVTLALGLAAIVVSIVVSVLSGGRPA